MTLKFPLLLCFHLAVLYQPPICHASEILRTGEIQEINGTLQYITKKENPYFVVVSPLPIRALSKKEEPIVTRTIQLADLNEEEYKKALLNQGTKVTVKGRILEAHTPYHHHPLILFISSPIK